jgi:antitoxin CptB
MINNNREILLKKLLYRSVNRGCKETDILLGEFAKVKINDFDDENLLVYKNLIEEDDLEIYDWILGKRNIPDKYKNLVLKIGDFHKLN